MSIGRISGPLLKDNLLRDGVNLKFENDLLYLLVNDPDGDNHKVGIKNSNPAYTLDVIGTIRSVESPNAEHPALLADSAQIDLVVIDNNVVKSYIGDLEIRAATSNDSIKIYNDVRVEGNLHATGNITADGSLTLGDNDTDDIIFKADINSDIIPNQDDSFDLGSLTKSWRRVYVDDMRLGDPEGTDGFDFSQTSIVGSGTLPNKIFNGIDVSSNYTKINNTNTNGHLTLSSNGNGLIELTNDTRVHQDLNVLGDIATDNANYILLGDPEYGILDGAVEMTPQTSLTDGVAQLNLTLTLLVPPSPPSFPNSQNLQVQSLSYRMINLPAGSQLLNGNPITAPAQGTTILVARVNTFQTNTITETGPGNRGTITVKRNTQTAATKLLTYGNSTQVITTVFTATTIGSQEVRYTQPSAGVLIVGYLIRTATGQIPFGGLVANQTYIITAISSKVIKMSVYNMATGAVGAPFVATSTATGTFTFSSITDEGDYTFGDTNLNLSNNIAYPLTTPGFHETVNYTVNGENVPAGWNTVQIIHSDAGQTSISEPGQNDPSVVTGLWYYDSSPTLAPVFSNQTFVLRTEAKTYSSTIPHYNNGTKYEIAFTITWNGGETAHDFLSYELIRTGATGPWTNSNNKTYLNLGYTYLEPTTTVTNGLGPNNTDFTVNVISGFGAWTTTTTVPVFNIDNSYADASSSLPALNSIILYKTGTTGTASFLEETNIHFSSSIGTGSGAAARCENPDAGTANQDTPAFTAGSTLFNSETSTLFSTDATVVGTAPGVNTLKHDRTNYSTGYLPVGPNLSTRSTTDAQYFTFRFVRQSLSKFAITYTTSTGVAAIFCAMPGAGGTESSLNKWLDLRIDNSLANGCALGGNMDPSATGTKTYNCSFGLKNSTNADNNEIWVRIKLNPGQSITRLSLGASTI
jgi:hypothetical protein